jgi:hypothetical protein
MRIRRELGAVLAGILTTVLVTAAVEFGRRSGLLQRQPARGARIGCSLLPERRRPHANSSPIHACTSNGFEAHPRNTRRPR